MARKRHRSKGRRFLFCLILIALVVIGYNRVFRVHHILVEGMDASQTAYVAGLSGVPVNSSIFSVNAHDVEAALSADPYLAYSHLEIRYPDTLLLHVTRRQPAGAISVSGVYILIDETGHILENTTRLPAGMPFVTGVKISSANTGTKLTAVQSDQIDILLSILDALRTRNMLDMISQVDVADRFNLYLVTDSGVRAILGTPDNLDDKVMWLQVSLEEMAHLGYTGGQLDLSSGKNAVFSPAVH